MVEALVTARSRRADSRLEFLTPREQEVLAEMAQGRNNAAVASALGLSERAVEKHINSVFSKLGLSEEPDVNRRVKAVLLYLADRPRAELTGPENRVGEERDHRGERERAGDGHQDAERRTARPSVMGRSRRQSSSSNSSSGSGGSSSTVSPNAASAAARARAFAGAPLGLERCVVRAPPFRVAEHPPGLVDRGHVVTPRAVREIRDGSAGRARGTPP